MCVKSTDRKLYAEIRKRCRQKVKLGRVVVIETVCDRVQRIRELYIHSACNAFRAVDAC